MLQDTKGSIYAISCGLLYGLIGYFGINLMNSGLAVYNMLFWRFVVASIFIAIVLIPKFAKLKESKKEVFKVLIYGALFHGPSAIIFFIAAQYIGSGLAMVLFFIFPIFVVILNSILHKVKITKTYYLSSIAIIIGIILLVDINNLNADIIGIAIGATASIFYAAYIIGSKSSKVSPLPSSLAVCVGCAISCLFISLIQNNFQTPSNYKLWLEIIAMGILCTSLPILLFLAALQYINSAKASILSMSEPISLVVFGIILLDEKITLMQFLGIIIIMGAAVLVLLKDRRI